jgi:hypothetical protein
VDAAGATVYAIVLLLTESEGSATVNTPVFAIFRFLVMIYLLHEMAPSIIFFKNRFKISELPTSGKKNL